MIFNIILFISLFLIVYLMYYLFVIRSKKAMIKMQNGKEMLFLKRNYHLDYDKLDTKKVANSVALINAFIISFTTEVVCLLNSWISNFYLWLICSMFMAIVILFPLIIILYHLVGTYYNKKQKEM
ncbi:MAG: hypothetical protein IKN87_02370 [Bacilli bacterium]|nr:hypothetical protein [Bacilli bacterium]